MKGDCRAAAGDPTKFPDRIGQISESCSQMVLQFHDQIDVSFAFHVRKANEQLRGVKFLLCYLLTFEWVIR